VAGPMVDVSSCVSEARIVALVAVLTDSSLPPMATAVLLVSAQ
jgi:hypothetical protein